MVWYFESPHDYIIVGSYNATVTIAVTVAIVITVAITITVTTMALDCTRSLIWYAYVQLDRRRRCYTEHSRTMLPASPSDRRISVRVS
jgi:hypothetical protein